MGSKGFAWALSMFGLDLVEFLALLEVMFLDSHRGPSFSGRGFIGIYFWISTVSLVLQLVGVLLVAKGFYRLGGVVQIVSSSIHVPKGEGVIGVIGGLKAYRYPQALAAQTAAAAPDSPATESAAG